MKRKIFLAVLSLLVAAMFSGGVTADSSRYDVVVIGAGGGGLAAGATLARGGKRVLVLEQHYKVGGYMTEFERGPYTFEVSLHAVAGFNEGNGMSRGMFKKLGIMDRVTPVKLDPVYRVVAPDFELDVPADPHEFQRRLLQLFPAEQDGIEKFFGLMDDMNYAMIAGAHLGEGRSMEALAMVAKRPWFLRPMNKYKGKTVSELLDDYTRDPRLRGALSWMCGYGGAPPEQLPADLFVGMFAAYYYGGFYYFEGGSQAVSDAMAAVIRENGGEIKPATRAVKIVIENGRAVAVVDERGEEYRLDWVVSNASAPATLFELVGREHLPGSYVKKVESMKIGPSVFQVYLGVDQDYTELFRGGHTISVYDSSDLSGMYGPPDPATQGFFIVNYSAVEDDVAPEGHNVIAITTYLPYDWMNGWREEEDYSEYTRLKNETAMVFVKRAEKYLPGLSDHIEVMEVGSPRTMEHFTLNPKGAVYGWAIDMEHMGDNRLAQMTPVPNLLLAGAWTRPGHGQGSVMQSGINAAEMILKKK